MKHRLLSIRLFQRNQEHGGCKETQDMDKLLLKTIYFSYHME